MRLLEDFKQNAKELWREPKRFEEAYKINLRFLGTYVESVVKCSVPGHADNSTLPDDDLFWDSFSETLFSLVK
jgi:hypothetical protein